MSVADEITAAWDEARPILADAFHPDEYTITRMTRTADGYGGYTEAPVVVETGLCSLDVTRRMGVESISGSVMTAVASYTVELPIDTTLVSSDDLTINGREFAVVGNPREGGEHGIFVTADVEERQ